MKQKQVWAGLAGVTILVLIFSFTWLDDPLKRILSQLDKWTTDNPQEKVYLHLDKPYYAAGDNLWFKAYVTIGAKHQLSALSGILNVELLDDRDSIKQSIKLPLSNGTSWGDFALPDNLKAGTYHVRAYTNWMRNFSEAWFYNQPLVIGNALAGTTPAKADKTSSRSVPGQSSVQFFPESGNLVSGITSTVAFKAVGSNGLGIDIKGDVLDNTNRKVTSFTSQHLGMGTFALRPEAGKTYHAVISYPDGSQNSVNLPQVQTSGYALHITDAGDHWQIHITTSADLAGKNSNSQINLVGQEGGQVYYAGQSKLENNSFTAAVPKSRFPMGVAQFTLFSSNGNPVAERLVFVRNDNDLLKLNISTPKATYASREKTQVSLHVQDNSGKPVVGAFSAAVINESSVPVNEADESTILSNILLTSDLQGYIEQPGYYFTNISSKTQSDLDALMLTQGYRRFEWRFILANNFPVIKYPPEKALQISGTLTSKGKPVANGRVTLFTTAGGAFILDTVTNAQGRFAFHDLLFKDSIRFIIQARTGKNGKNVTIKMDQPAAHTAAGLTYTPDLMVNVNPGFASYLQKSRQQYDNDIKYGLNGHTIVLKEVVIKDKRPEVQNSTNLNGAGRADQIIKGDIFQQQGCINIAQCLQGRLVGVIFRGGVPYSTRSLNRPMQVIVDGAYVSPDYANQINPLDIGSIEVLRSGMYTAIYGGQGADGVFIINTRRGNDYSPEAFASYTPGIVTYVPKGFYIAREFYKPAYAGPAPAGAATDLRTTIDWEHSLVTDKDGNVSFSYYNADTKGTYRVVIEGIDDAGHLGWQVYRYVVN